MPDAPSVTSGHAAVLTAAASLRSALTAFDPQPYTGADCARIAEELAVTEKACQTARLLAAARAVGAGAHRDAGFRDGSAWLARQSGVTGQQAKRDLATVNRLGDCPQTRDALLAGEISMAQAAEITEVRGADPGSEGALVDLARNSDLSRVRDRAREQRQASTPARRLHDEQRRARSFRHWRDRLGMVCFAGQLPPEVGVPFVNRLEEATARVRRAARAASPGAPPEKWEAHAADAFARMCEGPGDAPRSRRSELVIVCDIYAWRRGHAHPGEPCHVVGGGPIPVDVARQLGQDAFIKAVLHDGTDIRTVEHLGRHIPAELRTALDLGPVPEFTGRQCAECGVRWGLEYDHIDPVEHKGPTSYDNIQALCWPDHQAKTARDRQAGLISDGRSHGASSDPPPAPPPASPGGDRRRSPPGDP